MESMMEQSTEERNEKFIPPHDEGAPHRHTFTPAIGEGNEREQASPERAELPKLEAGLGADPELHPDPNVRNESSAPNLLVEGES